MWGLRTREQVMNMKRWLRGGTIAAVLVFTGLWLGGCLECHESILGRYDADKDQFVFLNIYQRIGGEKPADFDYLEKLWKNRDHLITPPIPIILGNKTSYLRMSNTQFVTVNLGDVKELQVQESPVPLNEVQVQPGRFFLRGEDALCYYDQIVVPGAFVDKTLKMLSGQARQ